MAASRDATSSPDTAPDVTTAAPRARRQRTFWGDTVRGFRQRVPAMAGVLLVGLFLLATLIGLFGTPDNTNRSSLAQRLRPPDVSHPFGTDGFGREIIY